jgi:lipid-A-disaccharide synthase
LSAEILSKFYIIAGEASGDLHGSNLMRALKQQAPETEFAFWGGEEMRGLDGNLRKHIKELAFMGFVEVLMNLRTIFKNIDFCKKDILNYQPDALILIDYPGFNLRIAKWAKSQGIPVLYYISPQIWAWKQKRVHLIKKVVDEMYCILPFEKDFYQKFDMSVQFVGHPLIDAIANFQEKRFQKDEFLAEHQLNDKPILALLPGSRNQEIKVKLPLMWDAAQHFAQDYQILIAGAPNQTEAFYHEVLQNNSAKIVSGATYGILSLAELALVTSGTATLETALFKVPQVVCYKGSKISYTIAKRLIKVKYISLVNLILDEAAVVELIQGECTSKNMVKHLLEIQAGEKQKKLLENYEKLAKLCGGGGASERTAMLMLKKIQKR